MRIVNSPKSVLALFVMAAIPFVDANAESPQTLAGFRSIYQQQSAAILETYTSACCTATSDYRNALVTLEDDLKKAGDLNGVLACQRERGRFDTEGTVTTTPPELMPTPVLALQTRYNNVLAAAGKRRDAAAADLTRRYLFALEEHKRELTRADRLQEAIAVDEEMKRIEFLSAVSAAGKPPPVTPSPAPVNPPPAAPPAFSIVKATYGIPGQMIDVTGKIRKMVKDDVLDLRGRFDHLFGDPSPGNYKSLIVTYALDGKAKTAVLSDYVVRQLPFPEQTSELTIIEAVYGTKKASFDVTDTVQSMVDNNKLTIQGDLYKVFGDPLPGAKKTLKLRYRAKQLTKNATFDDGEPVSIP